jgi:hypothetical protein
MINKEMPPQCNKAKNNLVNQNNRKNTFKKAMRYLKEKEKNMKVKEKKRKD